MKMNYKIVEHTFSIGHTIQGAIRQNSEDYISENEMILLMAIFNSINNRPRVTPNSTFPIPVKTKNGV